MLLHFYKTTYIFILYSYWNSNFWESLSSILITRAGCCEFCYNAVSALFCLLHFFSGNKNTLFWSDYSSWGCKGLFSYLFSGSIIFLWWKMIKGFYSQQYQATGRGFVVRHIKFSENYRLYSRSHFVKGYSPLYLSLSIFIYPSLSKHLSFCLWRACLNVGHNLHLLILYHEFFFNMGNYLYLLLWLSSD